jgi:hypothetical protein
VSYFAVCVTLFNKSIFEVIHTIIPTYSPTSSSSFLLFATFPFDTRQNCHSKPLTKPYSQNTRNSNPNSQIHKMPKTGVPYHGMTPSEVAELERKTGRRWGRPEAAAGAEPGS